VAALEEAGVRAYVALHESGSRPGLFAKGEFRYDSEADVYSCPAGKLLRPVGKKEGEDRGDRETYYRARASECAPCPLKPRCTDHAHSCIFIPHHGISCSVQDFAKAKSRLCGSLVRRSCSISQTNYREGPFHEAGRIGARVSWIARTRAIPCRGGFSTHTGE
jgi:hypothetical protein